MTKIGQKIKDALTPGSSHKEQTTTTTGAYTGTTEACDTCVPAPTQQTGQVCGQETFTRTEDRPIVKERVETVLQHHPIEKEFVTETRPTGVEYQHSGAVESMGVTERVVSQAPPSKPCDM